MSVVGGTHGFTISSKSWVVIQNISVSQTSSDGIYVANSSNIRLSNDHVSYAGRPVQGFVARGIRLTGDTNPVVSGCVLDHNSEAGVYLVNGTTGAQIVGNQIFANARQYTPPTGTSIGYDRVSLHQPSTMFIWGSSFYSSLAALTAATGQEAHGIQADPGWAAPNSGDLHLLAGSPGIDSANSGVVGEPQTDADGNARVDDPSTPNTGAGPRSYD